MEGNLNIMLNKYIGSNLQELTAKELLLINKVVKYQLFNRRINLNYHFGNTTNTELYFKSTSTWEPRHTPHGKNVQGRFLSQITYEIGEQNHLCEELWK